MKRLANLAVLGLVTLPACGRIGFENLGVIGEEQPLELSAVGSPGEPTTAAALRARSGDSGVVATEVTGPGASTPKETAPTSDAGRNDGRPGTPAVALTDASLDLCLSCDCRTENAVEYAFCEARTSWQEAQATCEGGGARLVRVDSAEENAFLVNTVLSLSLYNFWAGGDDLEVYRDWRWQDGTLFWRGGVDGTSVGGLFSAWGELDPNDFGGNGERCLLIDRHGDWKDELCSLPEAFVCELSSR